MNSVRTLPIFSAAGGARRLSEPSGSGAAAAGAGPLMRLAGPVGVALDAENNIYVAESGNVRILKIAADGSACVLAGSADSRGLKDGIGTAATFSCPMYVALDMRSGTLFVTDKHAVRKVSLADGSVSTVAGSEEAGNQDGPIAKARFYNLRGIALDADSGCIFVADSSNHTVRCISLNDGMVSTLAGAPGVNSFSDGRCEAARFRNPCGLALAPDGGLVVADAENNRIRKVCKDGQVVTVAGSGEVGFKDDSHQAAQFNHPQGLAIDADGNIVVADLDNHRIRMVCPSGVVTSLAGSGRPGGADAHAGMTATFFDPVSVAMTARGELVVAETSSSRLRLVRTRLRSQAASCAAMSLSTFTADMLALLASGEFADVTFVVAGQHIPAHCAILCARCEAFKRMFAADMVEGRSRTVEVEDTSAGALRALLRYLYTDQLIIGSGVGAPAGTILASISTLSSSADSESGSSSSHSSRSAAAEPTAAGGGSNSIGTRSCPLSSIKQFEAAVDDGDSYVSTLLQLTLLARKYLVMRLYHICCDQVRGLLREGTACRLLAWADDYGVQELRPHLWRYVVHNLRAILSQHPDSLQVLSQHPEILTQLLLETRGGGRAS